MSKTTFEVDKKNLEVRMSRVYAATPERIFKAYTDPTELPKWWGPSYLTTTIDKFEPKVGGKWHFIQRAPDGGEHIFNGVFREIDEPTKLVYTFEYEAVPGHVLVETVTLEAQDDGKTRVNTVSKYDNEQDLTGMVEMDMESGAVESTERLAKLVE